jgi:hypothetical protein
MAHSRVRCKTCIKLALDGAAVPDSKPSPAGKRKRSDTAAAASSSDVKDTDAKAPASNRQKFERIHCKRCGYLRLKSQITSDGYCVRCDAVLAKFPCGTCGVSVLAHNISRDIVNCKQCFRVKSGLCRASGSCADLLAKGSRNCRYHDRAFKEGNVITDSDDEEGTAREKAHLKMNGDPETDSDGDADADADATATAAVATTKKATDA